MPTVPAADACVFCSALLARNKLNGDLDHPAAAQRAGRVPEQPDVDARQVERVPAPRQPPRRLAGLEVLQADGAPGPVAAGAGGRGGEGRDGERLDGGGRHALGAGLEHVRQRRRRRLGERRVHGVHLRARGRKQEKRISLLVWLKI